MNWQLPASPQQRYARTVKAVRSPYPSSSTHKKRLSAMPTKPLRPCPHQGCGELTNGGRCDNARDIPHQLRRLAYEEEFLFTFKYSPPSQEFFSRAKRPIDFIL
jgi:hypothetical protein